MPSQKQLWEMLQQQQKLVEQEQKDFLDQPSKFKEFTEYAADNMVPMQELVLGPKRLTQRERDLELARATSSFKNASDKKAVGFLADLKIDIRDRQEVVHPP